MKKESEWTATDSQDNATATATKAANSHGRHVVTHIAASFSGAVTKLLQLKHGTTVVFEHYVVNSVHIDIPEGLRTASNNQDVSAVLAASGAGSTIGKVNLMGYTIGGP